MGKKESSRVSPRASSLGFYAPVFEPDFPGGDMRIDRLEVFYVALPLIYPWKTAYGEDADIHSVLVRMFSGDSEGWGETSPFFAPTYSPETASSVFFLITEIFGPQIVGKEWESAAALRNQLAVFK